jgi:hypothetical protein
MSKHLLLARGKPGCLGDAPGTVVCWPGVRGSKIDPRPLGEPLEFMAQRYRSELNGDLVRLSKDGRSPRFLGDKERLRWRELCGAGSVSCSAIRAAT